MNQIQLLQLNMPDIFFNFKFVSFLLLTYLDTYCKKCIGVFKGPEKKIQIIKLIKLLRFDFTNNVLVNSYVSSHIFKKNIFYQANNIYLI